MTEIEPAPDTEPVTRTMKVRVIGLAIGRTVLMAVGVLVAYSLIAFDRVSTAGIGLVVAGAVVFLLVVNAWELRAITNAKYPTLRAVQSLVISIVVLLVTFAGIYIELSDSDGAAFNEPLGHVAALYFALTTLATVGYGDIAPVSDAARIVVMVQMVIDLAVIGVFIKLVTKAVRSRLSLPTEES